MKNLVFLFASIIFLSGCRSSKPVIPSENRSEFPVVFGEAQGTEKEIDYHDQTTMLLGYFNPAMLRQPPHTAWFVEGYDDYFPETDVVNRLLDIPMDDVTIKIVMGTWCPDSRREVPRFVKILDMIRFPAEKITFVGVDMDKRSPVGKFEELKIERVPTIIFYKKNIEAGRIIEVPQSSLEQDMVKILSGMNN
ncbi:MAG TPA: thioredoxin family protein [Bacteroidales bacterium]|nr:thioredoxin family protein [Bacteroidales bacterium]